jgi:hypothetical protein
MNSLIGKYLDADPEHWNENATSVVLKGVAFKSD